MTTEQAPESKVDVYVLMGPSEDAYLMMKYSC